MRTEFLHQTHGDFVHDLAIFLIESEMVRLSKEGMEYKFLDKRWFKDKAYSASIPDIYVQKTEKGTTQKGRRTVHETRYVLEIESHATAASIAKKREHFLESATGHELIIINLDDYPNPEDMKAVARFQNWLKERIP